MKKSELKTYTQKVNIAVLVLLKLLETFSFNLPQDVEKKLQELINFLYDNYYPSPICENDIDFEKDVEYFATLNYWEILD